MSSVAGRDGTRFTFGYKSIFAQIRSEDLLPQRSASAGARIQIWWNLRCFS
jgi:hypothetical protein